MVAYGAADDSWRKMAGKFLPRVQILATRTMHKVSYHMSQIYFRFGFFSLS